MNAKIKIGTVLYLSENVMALLFVKLFEIESNNLKFY